jgi:26S proteasome regulatory subunit N12
MNLLFPVFFDPSRKNVLESDAHVLLGLYLLSLLVRNQLAEFHVTLEQINVAPGIDGSNAYIQFPVQLQQCLVEGTYHRVVLARQQVPSPDYAWFIDALMDTIRYEAFY